MKNIKTIFSYLVVAALIFGFSISCKNKDKTGSESGIPAQYDGYYVSDIVDAEGDYYWLHVRNGEAGEGYSTSNTVYPTTFDYLPFTGSGTTYSISGNGNKIVLTFSSDDNTVTMDVSGTSSTTINLKKVS